MRRGLGVACSLLVSLAPAAARAQAPDDAERAAIETQVDVATGTYVASAVLGVGGIVALPVGLIGWMTADPSSSADGMFALFVGGSVALPLSLIVLAVAIGLHVDASIRRGRLGALASLGAGPGEPGLSLALAF